MAHDLCVSWVEDEMFISRGQAAAGGLAAPMSAKSVASTSCVSNEFVDGIGLPVGRTAVMHVPLCPRDRACRSRHSPLSNNDSRPGVHYRKRQVKEDVLTPAQGEEGACSECAADNCPGPHSLEGPQRRLCR